MPALKCGYRSTIIWTERVPTLKCGYRSTIMWTERVPTLKCGYRSTIIWCLAKFKEHVEPVYELGWWRISFSFHLQIIVKRAVVEAYVASPHYVGAMPHVHHPTSYASATQAADCRGREHHLDVVNSSKSTLDHFLNPAHSSYYPGFPLNISIAVCTEGVLCLPILSCTIWKKWEPCHTRGGGWSDKITYSNYCYGVLHREKKHMASANGCVVRPV